MNPVTMGQIARVENLNRQRQVAALQQLNQATSQRPARRNPLKALLKLITRRRTQPVTPKPTSVLELAEN